MRSSIDLFAPVSDVAQRTYGMSDADYFAIPALSATMIKTAALHGLASLRDMLEGRGETSKAQRIGWLCHLKVNSPHDWKRVAYPPESLTDGITTATGKESKRPTATAEYERRLRDWEEQHTDAIRITREEFHEVERITAALTHSACYAQCQNTEVVVTFNFFGLPAKARIDGEFIDSEGTVHLYDWKFVAGTRDFNHRLIKYGYHMQAAYYLHAYKELGLHPVGDFYLVGIDKETASPDYTVCAPVGDDLIQIGMRQCVRWAEKIKEAMGTGYWPGADSPREWSVPSWYRHELDQQVSEVWMP